MWPRNPAFVGRLWQWGGLAGILLAEVLLADWLRVFPNGIIEDNGYFYAKIAMNLGASGHSSFDGIHTTSGYHLAWGALLGAVSAVLGVITNDIWLQLSVFHFLGLAIFWIAIVACIEQSAVRIALIVLAAVNFNLTEMALLAAVLLFLARIDWTNPSHQLTRRECALLFVVPLVRVDAAIFVLLPAAWFVFQNVQKAKTAALFVVIGVIAQLACMYAAFGEFFSVAAQLKVAGFCANIGTRLAENCFGSKTIALKFVATAITLGVLASLWNRHRRDSTIRSVFLICLSSCSFLILHLVATRMRNWYWLPPMTLLGFVVDRLATQGVLALSMVSRMLGAFSAATLVGMVALVPWYRVDRINTAGVVAAIQKYVPPDGRIFQVDSSGFVGFASERAVVNGDGLVNDHAYLRRTRSRTLLGYLDEQRICWIVTNMQMRDWVVRLGGLAVSRKEVDEQFAVATLGRSRYTEFRLFRRRDCGW